MEELARRIAAAREVDLEEFEARVAADVDELKAELAVGTFDNQEGIVGMELEFYAADVPTGVLRRVPGPLLELMGFEKELGLHNAELVGRPQPLGFHGLSAVRHEAQAAVETAHSAATTSEHMRLVSDGFWTIPPAGETAAEYLGASVEIDGIVLAPNMPASVRYQVMSNSSCYEPAMRIDAPNVTFETETIMPCTLLTSVQPHYQVPIAANLPTHFRYALRVAAPLLALSVNSPLFPPSLYDHDATVESVLEQGHRENRVGIYESVMNDLARPAKVRFPRDLETVEEAVDRIAEDPPISPVLLDAGDRFDDRFAHLCHKHGSYWRWVRPVFEGETRAAANARIEFRPLPAQPTVRDSVALVAAVAGLLGGLVDAAHPVEALPWDHARENFYAAARDGLDADLVWITAGGEETTDTDALYADLFEHAAAGLRVRGFDDDQIEASLGPLRSRVDRRTTPASWKRDRLRHHAEAGESLSSAVLSAKGDYIAQQSETLVEGIFTDWPGV